METEGRPGRSDAAAEQHQTLEQFMDHVRNALDTLGTKLDNVIKGQDSLENKLGDIDTRVKKNTVEIANVAKTIDFTSSCAKDNADNINDLSNKVGFCTADIEAAKATIQNLQLEVLKLERYTRGFNVRITGLAESTEENCLEKVHSVLLDKFGLEGSIVENAHRVGKSNSRSEGTRVMIARIYSRATRGDVMRNARTKLQGSGMRIMDDLTAKDMEEKRRIQPYMDKLWQDGKRPSFRNGTLYAERRPVQREVINAWLSSDEGIAASRAAADRRPQRRNDIAPDNTGSSGRPR